MAEFAAWDTNPPGYTKRPLLDTGHGIWKLSQNSLNASADPGTVVTHTCKEKYPQTPWFMPPNMIFALTHEGLFSLRRLLAFCLAHFILLSEAFQFTEASFFFTSLQQWELAFFFCTCKCTKVQIFFPLQDFRSCDLKNQMSWKIIMSRLIPSGCGWSIIHSVEVWITCAQRSAENEWAVECKGPRPISAGTKEIHTVVH